MGAFNAALKQIGHSRLNSLKSSMRARGDGMMEYANAVIDGKISAKQMGSSLYGSAKGFAGRNAMGIGGGAAIGGGMGAYDNRRQGPGGMAMGALGGAAKGAALGGIGSAGLRGARSGVRGLRNDARTLKGARNTDRMTAMSSQMSKDFPSF